MDGYLGALCARVLRHSGNEEHDEQKKNGDYRRRASGLMAAVAAADNRKGAGDEVVILEKKERVGKKILVTGNGKCNLTNLSFSMEKIGEYYHGAPEERLRSIFSRSPRRIL